MEKITIENFAGIKHMEFEFKSINVLIGPQGSGKSISVKLLYFFKSFLNEIYKSIDLHETKREVDTKQKEIFINFFPRESWPKNNFTITYNLHDLTIIVSKNKTGLSFTYSENLKKIIGKGRKILQDEEKKLIEDPKLSSFSLKRKSREKFNNCLREDISPIASFGQFFVPAGRSFFANIQSGIFSFLSENRSLDPFLIKFGSFYENLKRVYNDPYVRNKADKNFDDLIVQILNSTYDREKEKDFLLHRDNRKVNLANASSGQQETLPLMVILKVMATLNYDGDGTTLYIEEPEAHLFPTAQKRMVQLLARVFNSNKPQFQIIVTTHSPYILSSFNNLLQAGKLVKEKPDRIEEINSVIPKEEQLECKSLTAYSIEKGKNKLLIDEETGLIKQTILDEVSNEIAEEFGNLLDIEF